MGDSINNITITGLDVNYSDEYNISIPDNMLSSDTITIMSSGGSYTLNDTVTISGDTFNWAFHETTPFEDGFPEWNEFQNMCEEYPGLQKTYEHLKAFYKLCSDDWQAKKEGKND